MLAHKPAAWAHALRDSFHAHLCYHPALLSEHLHLDQPRALILLLVVTHTFSTHHTHSLGSYALPRGLRITGRSFLDSWQELPRVRCLGCCQGINCKLPTIWYLNGGSLVLSSLAPATQLLQILQAMCAFRRTAVKLERSGL